jgi:hypothetical protein
LNKNKSKPRHDTFQIDRHKWFVRIYCLGKGGLPNGASLGLQASGLPSGAQQVPFMAPRGDVKLHTWPLLKD